MLAVVCLAAMQSSYLAEVSGKEVTLRLQKSNDEIIENFYAKDKDGHEHLLLVSPTAPGLGLPKPGKSSTALQTPTSSLYPDAPTFQFTDYKVVKGKDGTAVTLTSQNKIATFTKTIIIPAIGHQINVSLDIHITSTRTFIDSLLLSYAFLPDGKTMSQGGKPDSTFLPGIRPEDDEVVGDHVFRAPVAMAQQGNLAAMILPDLDVLKDNRPIPTILDLDCKNGVVDAPLMSYGFAAYKVRPHVYYATDFGNPRLAPSDLHLSMAMLLNANATPNAAYEEANKFEWDRYGKRYFNQVLPQALPFEEYAKYCYPAAFTETVDGNQVGWFEQKIDGQDCGGIPAGWGYDQGLLYWQDWFNNLRSAYGLHSWGVRLNNQDWIDKSDKMLNLALAAPMDDGACPTGYNSAKKVWLGSLIKPANPVGKPYYDLTNMAWKGIWLLRWANDFKDCPRKQDILTQCRAMADCMMHWQNSDGSIPTWLTQNLKLVPVLDHSAQSALPAWFMFELAKVDDGAPAGFNDKLRKSALNAADFLDNNVVDGQYYYDFETFFSCSAKPCLQVNGAVDNEGMRDPHTLQPPQNTLSMQWTAEALREAYHATKNQHYLDQAMKALEKMNLYQIVWPISYCKTAYVYGGFGVQNSDAEYNDARQAQFGETLCDFGAEFGRQDLFERGVAAVRASLALINHPLHDQYGIYPHPNYAPGLEPENCCHAGDDSQAGRTGFDWGEGSGLTSMAILLDKYGDAYVDNTNHIRVGINGVVPFQNGFARRMIFDVANNATSGSQIDIKTPKGDSKAKADLYPGVQISSGVVDGQPQLLISLFGATAADLKAQLSTDDGGAIGLSVQPTEREIRIPLTDRLENQPIQVVGTLRGVDITTKPITAYVNPSFDLSPGKTSDWQVEGNFQAPFAHPTRMDFGLDPNSYMIGTCEDGKNGYDDTYTGTITSPPFLVTKPTLFFMVGGGAGQGEYVELIDASTGEQLDVVHGSNMEVLVPVKWDISKFSGRMLQLRIVDQETGGWGHINVANIHCE